MKLLLGSLALLTAISLMLAALAVFDAVPAPIRDAVRYLRAPPLNLAELGDGGPAHKILLFDPGGLARHPSGDVLISDRGRDYRGGIIWRISQKGIAHAIAGNGQRADACNNQPAKNNALASPEELVIGPDGLLYFGDSSCNQVLRINAQGNIEIVAGNGEPGYSGDGGPATSARLHKPYDLTFDASGQLLIADSWNHRIRLINKNGHISTLAGTGVAGYSGDGGPAKHAQLDTPYGIAVTPEGEILVADSANNRVRKIDLNGTITTLAGTGEQGMAGNGGPAAQAQMDSPQALALLPGGGLVIGDEHNHMLRLLQSDGEILHLVGTGKPGKANMGTNSAASSLNDPEAILPLSDNELLVAEGDNHRVLRVPLSGPVSLFAGAAESDF